MDFNEIKKIIKEEGGKVIVACEGEPTLIIMTLEDYRGKKEVRSENKVESAPKVPRELETESLKIDDLPF